jgi:hypothetical protein
VTAETAWRWPVDLARTELVYCERLRRARATTEARTHLAAALDTFRRLGATPWAHRAQQELRAAGHTGALAVPAANPADVLTPQQLQIAQLAASGLTNKQIGERLYLSHRDHRHPPVPDSPNSGSRRGPPSATPCEAPGIPPPPSRLTDPLMRTADGTSHEPSRITDSAFTQPAQP